MPAKSTRRFSLRRVLWAIGLILLLPAAGIALANGYIIAANESRLITGSIISAPKCDVALVLGTSPWLSGGRPNLHYVGRIETAAKLYHAGKVRHLLVSGDNRRRDYNEPHLMRASLVKLGVPVEAITCDYGGFRTLDSVTRAKDIFQVKTCLIVTQQYHNYRALEIARHVGLDAWGFCAPAIPWKDSFMTECREALARAAAVFELHVLRQQPNFVGQPEPIRLPPP
ncbi:MAG TPA: ElyC/SanA/YdcF family protein [Candidatus Didemnitutus sp.]|nr:ElyC/SanA/YdcF family protein [Candidatus Didemnitutus sp.]